MVAPQDLILRNDLAVHDDAVMQYLFFHAGKERDGYWSTPGYFDDQRRYADEAQFVTDRMNELLASGGRNRDIGYRDERVRVVADGAPPPEEIAEDARITERRRG